MDSQSEEMSGFFNKETREITFVSEEEFRMAENEVDINEFPEWLQDQVKLAEEILYGDKWIPLPSKFEIHEYNIMEEFALSIEKEKISDIMYYSLKGKGAFSRFRDNTQKYNLEENWYKFRAESLREIALDWCEANNIPYED